MTKNKENAEQQSSENILPPFSKKLKVDRRLVTKSKLVDNPKLVKKPEEMLKATAAYPKPYIFAKFAKIVYVNYNNKDESIDDYEKRLALPSGWKLLMTGSNLDKTNGYFGASYWHPENRHVIIAHRGTDNLGAGLADIRGVLFNNYVSQMNSATTFADKVINHLKGALSREKEVEFQLFFTGHSLGGWLAQITTFTTEYLERIEEKGVFLKSETAEENLHPHTVVFDSPGCKEMLLKMKDKLYPRQQTYIDLQNLDITSYLSAPNRVNTCNRHLGTVFRIFIELTKMGRLEQITPMYNLFFHSMDKILNAFDPVTEHVLKDENGQSKIQEAVDWPVSTGLFGGEETNKFFKVAQKSNSYHPTKIDDSFPTGPVNGYYPIRYQTKNYNENACSLSVFTQSEQKFLKRYNLLKAYQTENIFCKIFDESLKQGTEKLQNFKIVNENILLNNNEDLLAFIPYVKNLIKIFPVIKDNIKKVLEEYGIVKIFYQHKSDLHIDKINKSPLDFNLNEPYLNLKSFLDGNNQVFQLKVDKDTWIGLIKVYKVFKKTPGIINYQDESCYTVLKLTELLGISEPVGLKTLLKSTTTPFLLMVECNTDLYDPNSKNKELFKELLTKIREKNNIKIILIISPADKSFDFIRETTTEEDETNLQIKWRDITTDSQKKLLEKTVDFQGYDVPLYKLINVDAPLKIGDAVLCDILKDQLPKINHEPIRFSDLETAYVVDQGDKKIEIQHFVDTLQDDNTLLVVSGLNLNTEKLEDAQEALINQLNLGGDEQQKRRLKEHIVLAAELNQTNGGRVIILPCYGGLDCIDTFHALCRDIYAKPHLFPSDFEKKAIHWVAVEKNQLFCKKSVDFNFYCPRNLKIYQKIVLKQEIEKIIKSAAPSEDRFIIEPLPHADAIDGTNRNLISVTPAETAEDTSKNIASETSKPIHWVKEELQDDEKRLVWQRSRGSIKRLSEFFDRERSQLDLLDDDKFSTIKQKVLIITDYPGMGKSTTLTRLSRKAYKDAWVIRLNFKELQPLLENLNDDAWDYNSASKFLADGAEYRSDNMLQRFLLQHNLEHKTQKPLLLLLDGFDEIQGICNKKRALKFLEFLKDNTPTCLRITTRETDKDILEENLHPFSSTFEALQSTDKEEFLRRFWRIRFFLTWGKEKCDEVFSDREASKFKSYVDPLLCQVDAALGEQESQFMGIPLQIQLLAVGFQENFEKFVTSEASSLEQNYFESLSINELYLRLINSKYDLYIKEKSKANLLNISSKEALKSTYTKAHRQMALQLLFSKEESLKLLNNKENKYTTEDLSNIGIIQFVGDKNYFIHKTLAEYYVADFLVNQLRKSILRPSVEKNLMDSILLKPDFQTVRVFLNGRLTVNLPPDNILTEFGKENKFKRDEEYNTPFHIACKEGNNAIIDFLTISFKEKPQNIEYLMMAKEKLQKKTALHLAVIYKKPKTVDYLLNHMKCVDKDTINKLVLAVDFIKRTALHYAIEKDDKESTEKLLKFAKEKNTLIELLKATDSGGETALHVAVRNNNNNNNNRERNEILGCLLYFLKDILDEDTIKDLVLQKDSKNMNALHYAVGEKDSTEKLLEFAKDKNILMELLEATDGSGKTILHWAAIHKKPGVVNYLLNFFNDNEYFNDECTIDNLVLAKDRFVGNDDGKNALHYAVTGGGEESTKELLKFVKEKNKYTFIKLLKSTDVDGRTVLHFAAFNKKSKEILGCLFCFLKDNLDEEAIKNLVLAKDSLKMTVLHYAVLGSKESTKELLEFVKEKSDTLKELLKATDLKGRTALHYAVNNGVLVAGYGLNENEVSVFKQNHKRVELYWGSMNISTPYEEKLCYLLYFLEDNLDESTKNNLILATDNDKCNLLHCAACSCYPMDYIETTKQLLDFVSDKKYKLTLIKLVTGKDKDERTAIHLAAYNQRVVVLKYLLKLLIDSELFNEDKITIKKLVTDEDINGRNALCDALHFDFDREKITRDNSLLLQLIKANGNEFKIMLDYVSEKKSWETVLFFIEQGADIFDLSNTNYILLKEYVEKISSYEEKCKALELIKKLT